MDKTPEQNLKDLSITLNEVSQPIASYVNCVRTGNLLFLSGKGPIKKDKTYVTGKVGKDLTVEQGNEAARLVAIDHIAVLKDELRDLSKVKRIVKAFGMVNCTSDFVDQAKVINGYSDLMFSVFGEKGRHARSAVSMHTLPLNFAVEVELIVEIED
ncbi:RidA family protein [Salegentibacter sediminis]|uniref:RidA family protein n=1 Tax=Salegentibacter sediminis TaxID=1930251 RepID=UPI0009BD0AB1|nr:RidA family protein [Salegentibacter sediminis]